MTQTQQVVEASYAYCRQSSRRAGSSFYWGFRLLRPEKRRGMDALYAFMRHTDDLADSSMAASQVPAASAAHPTLADACGAAVAAWRAAVEQVLSGAALAERAQIPGAALLPALADTAARFHIPREHLLAVIDGVAMDLTPQRYETFADLRPYCERVASAVGLACIHIWGFRGPEALPHARSAGIALQLTNILRDLREDTQADRLYLPLADLRLYGYSCDDLRAAVDDERFRQLMAFEVARAEEFYRHGSRLMAWLEADGRRIFGFMLATYHELLRKIAQQPAAVLRGRVRLGRVQRLRLAARWALLPGQEIVLQ